MIKIKYLIDLFNDKRITKVFQFDRHHEIIFEYLYNISQEKIKKENTADLEYFLILWAYRFSKEIRKNRVLEEKLYDIFEYETRENPLKEIKKITFEAQIDDLPKKVFSTPTIS